MGWAKGQIKEIAVSRDSSSYQPFPHFRHPLDEY